MRTYLQANFSDLFNGDQIDLSKHLGYAQKTTILLIQANAGVTNFEEYNTLYRILIGKVQQSLFILLRKVVLTCLLSNWVNMSPILY